MTPNRAKQLLYRYNTSQLKPAEEAELEKCIELGLIQLEDLEDINTISLQLDELLHVEIPNALQDAYQEMLEIEQTRPNQNVHAYTKTFLPQIPAVAWIFGLIMLGIGISIGGYFFSKKSNPQQEEIIALSDQVSEMKEMIMLSLLEKESPTDRLKAVNMSQDLPSASEAVTKALFTTLNTDESVNVRLEALNALYQYAQNPNVREELIRSINFQDTPLMQIALAEVMVALQEKKSVPALQQLLEQDEIPEMVRKKIEEKIEILL
ncbi:MAG: HEAT repeat domain-containing protein [Bacteroidota bacterium]